MTWKQEWEELIRYTLSVTVPREHVLPDGRAVLVCYDREHEGDGVMIACKKVSCSDRNNAQVSCFDCDEKVISVLEDQKGFRRDMRARRDLEKKNGSIRCDC